MSPAESMTANELPRCGLYRTVSAIGEVPAERLVYFHNHGDPGPGVYFPERWVANRATFASQGTTLPATWNKRALLALPAEGFYRVAKPFHCCAKRCVHFTPEMFVQLGYNGAGRGLMFTPEFATDVIRVPDRGTPIDDAAFASLVALQVAERRDELALPRGIIVH